MCRTMGDILHDLRLQAGESQETVASDVGISRVAYTRYENGTRIPKANIAAALADHFGVEISMLTGNPSERTSSRLLLSDDEEQVILAMRQNPQIKAAVIAMLAAAGVDIRKSGTASA